MMPCLWCRLLYLSPHRCIVPLQITSTLCVGVCVCLWMRVCIHLCVCARLWGWVGTGVIITHPLCCDDGVGPFKNVISFMISHKKTWLFTNNHTVSELSLNPHTIKVHSSTCMFVCTQVWAHSNTHTHTTTTAYRHLCSNWCVLLLGIMKQWQWVSLQTKFLRLASAWIFLLWETWNNNRKFHFWYLGSRWHEVNQVGVHQPHWQVQNWNWFSYSSVNTS